MRVVKGDRYAHGQTGNKLANYYAKLKKKNADNCFFFFYQFVKNTMNNDVSVSSMKKTLFFTTNFTSYAFFINTSC